MDDVSSQRKLRPNTGTFLEVESEEERESRIQRTLESLNNTSTFIPKETRPFDFGTRTMFPVGPSEILARVQAFLPQLEASNAVLAQQVQVDPSSVDIEHVQQNDTQYIEMNLGLGVFEVREGSDEAKLDEEMLSAPSDSDLHSDSYSDSESDSDSDSSSSTDIIISTSEKYLRPIRPLPKRISTSPKIIVMSENRPSTS